MSTLEKKINNTFLDFTNTYDLPVIELILQIVEFINFSKLDQYDQIKINDIWVNYFGAQPLEEGISKCMTKAMDEAGIGIDDVDYMQIGVGQIPDGLSAHNLTFCDNFPDYLGLGIGKNR